MGVVRWGLGVRAGALTAASDLVFVVLGTTAVVRVWRVVTRRLLWRVRNTLFVTYLLLGLAPILLFGTLTALAAYLFAGQYATNTALRSLEIAAGEVRSESGGLAMLSMMNAVPPQAPVFNGGRTAPPDAAVVGLAVMNGKVWQDLPGTNASLPPHSVFAGRMSPSWLQSGFQGLVDLDGRLYLCSETEVTMSNRSGLVLASLPLTRETMQRMAVGLGRITLVPGKLGDQPPAVKEPGVTGARRQGAGNADDDVNAELDREGDLRHPGAFHVISGGRLTAEHPFWDTQVRFFAPITVQNWSTGKVEPALVLVASRPTLLYTRLFSTSTEVASLVRVVLLTVAAVVTLIELVALLMAAGLSRTITRSVAALYAGTIEIDRGNLAYRVPDDSRDQLGSLAASFNAMSGSMQELLEQQREKERLESELSIAKEVQQNLFPPSPLRYGDLEVHAFCIPARMVSGDYFDFFADQGHLCVALGDISGKGMPAALLMASLHAAVRALGLRAEAADGGTPSSSRLVGLLNRQLFQSTQAHRYATLFLTFYDPASRRLTYTNGGHLVPWLFASDGSHRLLDCGGSVVGLLNGLSYEEATLDFCPGDLLVAFSDGLTEAENEEGEFGEGRLLAAVSEHRHLPLEELATRVMGLVQSWIGSTEQADDMTILLARMH